MARRRGTTEAIVGIFVLASTLLLVIFVVIIGKRQNIFERRYEINAFFNNVGGLQTGAEVLLAGIDVGFVKNVRFGPNNRVEVVMSVKLSEEPRIRTDSVATIRTMGLMGDRYVAITVGSASEPPIPLGGTIKTTEIFELTDLIEEARPAIGDLESTIKNIADITGRLANPQGDAATILKNVKLITTDAREGKGTLGALLTRDELYDKANEVLDATRQTVDNLQVVSDNAKQASADLPGIMTNVKNSVQRFDEFSEKGAKVADDFSQIVDSGKDVMKKAETIATNIESASEDIKEATHRVGPLIESADQDITEARKVIEAAKHSWLLRGYFKPSPPSGPIAVEGRDVAQPEVTK